MEKLAKKIAEALGNSLNKNEEQVAVMAYGLTAIIQMFSILAVSVLFGVFAGVLPEVFVVFFSVGFLRRLIGGAHSKGIYSCFFISVFCIIVFGLLTKFVIVKYLPLYLIATLSILIYAYSIFLTYKLAPVGNEKKPISSEKKRLRLRKSAFIVLSLFVACTALLLYFQYIFGGIYSRIAVSLFLSVLWQSTMLTKVGHSFITQIDRLF